MMNEELEYWNDIKDFGSLYIEMELLVGLEPVLFVCVSEDDKKFLVMTYNSSKMTYIMRRITDSELLDMLDQKVTMEETFRRAEKIYKTYQKDDCILAEEFAPELFPAAMLPKKGATYKIKSQYILDYKKELKTPKLQIQFTCDKYKFSENTENNTYSEIKINGSQISIYVSSYHPDKMEDNSYLPYTECLIA